MEINTYIGFCLQYLKELQQGRTKPDIKGNNSSVLESKENVEDIAAVKIKLNELLQLHGKNRE